MQVAATQVRAPLRAHWVRVTVLVLAVANLVETVFMVWPRSAPLDAGDVWEFSVLIAIVLAVILAVLYRVRSTRGFTWVAAIGFVAMLLGSFALLWNGHPFTLLIGLGAFWMLLFVPPERAALPDDSAVLGPRERSR